MAREFDPSKISAASLSKTMSPPKKPRTKRLFETDGRMKEEGRGLAFDVETLVKAYVKKHPSVDLSDLRGVISEAGAQAVARAVLERRRSR